jgi:hypothetical protein
MGAIEVWCTTTRLIYRLVIMASPDGK